MEKIYYPDEPAVKEAMNADDPLLIVVSHDRKELIVSSLDASVEHNILLKKAERSPLDIDRYYRIVVNKQGADWIFVCPENYKGIPVKEKRIEKFFNDGVEAIKEALAAIGYDNVPIEIPTRYKRHLNFIKDNGNL